MISYCVLQVALHFVKDERTRLVTLPYTSLEYIFLPCDNWSECLSHCCKILLADLHWLLSVVTSRLRWTLHELLMIRNAGRN